MIDPSRAFGTVITVGASVVALDMMSRLGKPMRKSESKPYVPTFGGKNDLYKSFSFKPIRWRL